MKRTKLVLAMLPLMVFTSDLLAVSLIETKREEGQDTIYVDGDRMLITGMGEDIRMIMDLDEKKMFMVNSKNKSAMDMSEATWKALKATGEKKPPPKVDARLEKVGAGPEIAGYDTTHYKIYVDGHLCAEKWTSLEALKDSGFDEIWDEHGDFLASASIDADAHPCELGEYQVFRDDKYGVALKETDYNCETDEVLRIEHDVDVDRSLFEIPADYKVVQFPTLPSSPNSAMRQGQALEDGSWGWTWDGMDCSDDGSDYAAMYGEEMDEEYLDEEYADEEYDDEEYADEEYEGDVPSLEEMAEDVVDEEVEDLGDEIKSKFKGLMGKFKKKDKDDDN